MLLMFVGVKAQNPYAYQLSSANVTETGGTFKYTLNAPATSVDLKFYNGEEVVGTIAMPAELLTMGSHSYDVTFADLNLPQGVELTWKVVVQGQSVSAPVEITDRIVSFYSPLGVGVDVNPESDYFGTMYCTESYYTENKYKGTENYYTNQAHDGVGIGLYMFDPQFNGIKNNQGTYGFNCGLQSAGYTNADWRPSRIQISDDNRMFIMSSRVNTGNPIYEINRETMQASPLFDGTLDTSTGIVTNNGTVVAEGAGVGFDVKGTGSDLKIALMTCTPASTTATANYKTREYNLGTATSWGAAPSREIHAFDNKAINNAGINLGYDGNNGLWFCQYRGAPNANEPSLLHADLTTDVVDYADNSTVNRNGGFAMNKDHTLLVRGSALNYQMTVYSVGKDADNKPVLTELYTLTSTKFKGWNQFAFDYANNLVTCDNTAEYFGMIQLPNSEPVITPCKASYNFTIPATVYSIAGAPKEVFDAQDAWDPTNVNTEMTEEDGVYTWTSDEVELNAGQKIEFKVLVNHSWDESYGKDGGSENVEVEVPADGIYTLTVTYEPNNNNNVTGTLNLVQAIYGKVYIIGEVNGNSWSATNGVEMTTEDGVTYTANVTVLQPVTDAPALMANNNKYAYFGFTTKLADETSSDPWGDIAAYRFGAVSEASEDNPNGDFFIKVAMFGEDLALTYDNPKAFRAPEGNYQFTIDKQNMTLKVEGNTLTGIDEIGSNEVKSVRYYDMQGHESAVPFNGVNIVVKEMTDGSRQTTKIVK